MDSVGDGIQHGGPYAYSKRCRCAECRAWKAAKQRAERARRRSNPVPPTVKHGTYYCYTEYGCDCEPCSDAARVYRNRLREKRKKVKEGESGVP